MGKSCFHAVYAFNDDVFKRARWHIKNGSKRKSCKLVAQTFSDVTKQIKGCHVTQTCRNCMKEHIAGPESCSNSTLF